MVLYVKLAHKRKKNMYMRCEVKTISMLLKLMRMVGFRYCCENIASVFLCGVILGKKINALFHINKCAEVSGNGAK